MQGPRGGNCASLWVVLKGDKADYSSKGTIAPWELFTKSNWPPFRVFPLSVFHRECFSDAITISQTHAIADWSRGSLQKSDRFLYPYWVHQFGARVYG